ncbi:polyribonucleotide nucleotidyltransferase [Limisphaera ngatamarikiensis]|uniref:Polyribonucleotide nucleotidyltransferase n=1 Tax=Limisphaera ngatamarikiensis TaxID=1324935 RepID=A0A6M1RLH9_9BACT|nr:polyribonucleotide nucleotidyltransferase [Limisphaera ngatamarikiensis]NGO38513.1 polyribonucleotide nucleotidyltransferase [Limisphaera ngatamarikiensis]
MHTKVTALVGEAPITIETGKIAKQADGAVTVQLGETIVIVAAVAATKPREGADFFPLTVDYREKAAAAGRFPGGYFKREGRPTEKEIVTSRMIDRPIRPLFPKGWFNEVQVQAIVLSADGQNDPDVLCVNGASAALMVSDIPWDGPVAAVRIGRINGRFVVNPTHDDLERSDLDLVYVGTERELIMFEGSAREISESDFLAALEFGHQAIQPLIAAQKELAEKAGKPKRSITLLKAPEEILERARVLAGDRVVPALLTPGKLAREAAVNALFEEVEQKLLEEFGAEKVTDFVKNEVRYHIQHAAIRGLVLNEGKRMDGRAMDAIRPISCEVGLLPRAHGSALFTRGETQAMVLATLGTGEDAQEFDAYTGGATEKRFILHYNFPNFSVGETGRITGPGRREIGHGNLAERSLAPLLPLDDYPYTIRVTSEIMESNGSTSMATVCGGSLALMDAGIPLQRAVAGISIGLVTEYDAEGRLARYQLLTDIIGAEDHFGDMDCKIAGTDRGITGFQLDLKLRGLPLNVIAEAVERARVARLAILEEMNKVLSAPRPELSKYAPRILTLKIDPEKIGTLIGPGGKNIKKLVDESGCEIDIEDDGTVRIYSVSEEGMRIAREAIEALSAEAEVGKIYRGKVVTIKDFGAFVEFLPGKDGLVHISELANFRVKKTEDIVKIGDEIWVKVLGVDEKGRVRLSRKAAMNERDAQMAAQQGGGTGEGAAASAVAEGTSGGEQAQSAGSAPSQTQGASGGGGHGSAGGRSAERSPQHRQESRERGHRSEHGHGGRRSRGGRGGGGGNRNRDRR